MGAVSAYLLQGLSLVHVAQWSREQFWIGGGGGGGGGNLHIFILLLSLIRLLALQYNLVIGGRGGV